MACTRVISHLPPGSGAGGCLRHAKAVAQSLAEQHRLKGEAPAGGVLQFMEDLRSWWWIDLMRISTQQYEFPDFGWCCPNETLRFPVHQLGPGGAVEEAESIRWNGAGKEAATEDQRRWPGVEELQQGILPSKRRLYQETCGIIEKSRWFIQFIHYEVTTKSLIGYPQNDPIPSNSKVKNHSRKMVYSPKWSRINTIAPLYSTLPDMGKAGCPRYLDLPVGLAITPWGKVRGSAAASGKRSEGRSGAPWTVADLDDLGSATGTVRSTLWDHLSWREIPLDNQRLEYPIEYPIGISYNPGYPIGQSISSFNIYCEWGILDFKIPIKRPIIGAIRTATRHWRISQPSKQRPGMVNHLGESMETSRRLDPWE